jgi:hypothetical protein
VSAAAPETGRSRCGRRRGSPRPWRATRGWWRSRWSRFDESESAVI